MYNYKETVSYKNDIDRINYLMKKNTPTNFKLNNTGCSNQTNVMAACIKSVRIGYCVVYGS